MKNVLLVLAGVAVGFVGTCKIIDAACDAGIMEWKYYIPETGRAGYRGNVELPAEKKRRIVFIND